MGSRVGLECGLGVLTTPLAVLSAQVMCNTLLLLLTPCFCSQLSEVTVGFLGLLYLFHSEFTPAVHACSYLQSLIVSLYLLLKETFVQVPALQCCSRVPGFQSILVLLIIYNLRRAKNLVLISYKYKLLCLNNSLCVTLVLITEGKSPHNTMSILSPKSEPLTFHWKHLLP